MVLNRIQKSENVGYDYTDISLAFVKYGKNKYGSQYDFVNFKTLNVEDHNNVATYREEGFDIIIAANVLRATSDMINTITEINYLLKKGGRLVVNELRKGIISSHSLLDYLTAGGCSMTIRIGSQIHHCFPLKNGISC